MSITYDPVNKRPQNWVYGFFTVFTLLIVVGFYIFGTQQANKKRPGSDDSINQFESAASE